MNRSNLIVVGVLLATAGAVAIFCELNGRLPEPDAGPGVHSDRLGAAPIEARANPQPRPSSSARDPGNSGLGPDTPPSRPLPQGRTGRTSQWLGGPDAVAK